MEELFVRAALFLLDSAVSKGIDVGVKSFADHISNRALLKADEKTRDYLMNHLPDYEYEKIDSFLSKMGMYAKNQSSADWSILSAQTERVIEDFYSTHPMFKHEQNTLTPLIKQAIWSAYEAVMSQLGRDSRVLYNQALAHREANRAEHRQLKDDHQEMKYDLKDIKTLLLSQTNRKLSYAETVSIYKGMLQTANSPNCTLINQLIPLLKEQIDDRYIYYCTALKIYANVLTGTKNDVHTLTLQFSDEVPPCDIVNDVVLFLLQLDQKEHLQTIQSIIKDTKLLEIVNCYTSKNPNSLIEMLTNDDGILKDEYRDNECALWAFSNCSRVTGNKKVAADIYSKIDRIHSSIWSQWRKQEMTVLLSFTNLLINENADISIFKDQVNSLFSFYETFSQLNEEHYVEFADTLLSYAIVLPLEEFEKCYKKVTVGKPESQKIKRHWYSAHLSNNGIEEKEIREFCETIGDGELWSTYLFNITALNSEHVINIIENNSELLQKNFSAIMAYIEAVIIVKGTDYAGETITSFSIPDPLSFQCNVYFAEVCTRISNPKATDYLSVAVSEALNPSGNITVVHLGRLVALLVHAGQWETASDILQKYQDRDPALMLLRLKVLIPYKEQRETCCSLVANLECFYGNNSYFLYCKGILADYDLPGAGLEQFIKAYHLHPCPQYAEAVLVARLNRKVFVDDEIMSFALNSNYIRLLYLAGIIYSINGIKQKAHAALLQALVNCNETYEESLFRDYTIQLLGDKGHETPPETIEPGTCVVLKKDDNERLQRIWIHDDAIRIPERGSTFAGYEHITPNSSTAFSLLGLAQGDAVKYLDEDYKVVAINHGDVVAMQYCMQHLLDHNVLRRLSIDPDNLEPLFEELRKSGEKRSEYIDQVISNYKSLNPGLTLDLFAEGISKSYYKATYALSKDSKIPFWAGTDGFEINDNCIFTPSTIAVLSSLSVRPPATKKETNNFYATIALRQELELQAREHRNDNTTAVLGFDNENRPYMIENTPESKRELNLYFAYLNEWAHWANLLDPVSPQDFPKGIKSVADAIGIPNIEAITVAPKLNMLICCDDLMLRRYMRSIGINTATAIDVLIHLEYPFKSIIDAAKTLITQRYIFPITINFLNWLSRSFEKAQNEKELENYAILTIELIEHILGSDEPKNYFYGLYKQVIDSQIVLHPTLKWIINMELLRFFKNPIDNSHEH